MITKIKSLPLVSIIIPVYNGSNYLKEAIDSALAQTYENIEIIVVNDGSTDDTEEIALSYGNKIRYFSKENGGVASALNLAIKNSNGEYISWLSHDDVYSPNKIAKQISKIKDLKDKNTIIYTDWITIDKHSKVKNMTNLFADYPIHKLNSPLYPLVKGLIHGCSLLIPKKCFKDIGCFDETLKTTQDYDLWLKMFPHYKLHYIPEALIKSRTHSEQGSKTILVAQTEADYFWINLFERLSEKEMIYFESSVLSFYKKAYNLMEQAGYTEAQRYLEPKITTILNSKKAIKDIKISVIIPFFNRLEYTIEAVKSVLAQTHKNFELILVNDYSTEDVSVIQDFVKKDCRILLVNNEFSKGASGARNTGILKSTGDYIAFLDSDDLYLPNKLEAQIKYMYKHNLSASHTSYFIFQNEDEKIIDTGKDDYDYKKVLSSCKIATPTVMLEKKIIDLFNLKFNEAFNYGEDICFWTEIAKITEIKGINTALTKVRKDGRNTVDSPENLIRGLANIISYISTKENVEYCLDEIFSVEYYLHKEMKKYLRRKKFIFYRNKFWRLFYRLTYRVFLKHRYGKKVLREKYDRRYL